MSTPKEQVESVGVDIELSDIPASIDMQAVVNILREAHPEVDVEEIVAKVVRLLKEQGL